MLSVPIIHTIKILSKFSYSHTKALAPKIAASASFS